MCYLAVQLGLTDSMAGLESLVPTQQHSPFSEISTEMDNTIFLCLCETLILFSHFTPSCKWLGNLSQLSPGSSVDRTPVSPAYGISCAPAVCNWCICSLVYPDPRFCLYRWHNVLAAQEGGWRRKIIVTNWHIYSWYRNTHGLLLLID